MLNEAATELASASWVAWSRPAVVRTADEKGNRTPRPRAHNRADQIVASLASPYFEELPLPCPVYKMPHFT